MIFLAPGLTWVVRVAMVFVAGIVPVGYQIWRMGYYALPYPNTAVSKDAGGAKWSQGFAYLWNLLGPYLLWLPLVFLFAGAVIAWRGRDKSIEDGVHHIEGNRLTRLRGWLRTQNAVVVFILASADPRSVLVARRRRLHARPRSSPRSVLFHRSRRRNSGANSGSGGVGA